MLLAFRNDPLLGLRHRLSRQADLPSTGPVRQTAAMDRYEGPARLEWWANTSTCLAAAEIDLTITVQDAMWQATADPAPPLQGEDREGWSFLLRLSPYATLVLPGEANDRIEVHVEEADAGHLVLTAPWNLAPHGTPNAATHSPAHWKPASDGR